MDLQKALEALQFTQLPTEEELRQRFRRAAKAVHSDITRSDDGEFLELQAAYETLLKELSAKSLVPVGHSVEITNAFREMQVATIEATGKVEDRARRDKENKALTARLIQHRVAPYKRQRNLAVAFSVSSAAIAAAHSGEVPVLTTAMRSFWSLFPNTSSDLNSEFIRTATLALVLLSILLGSMAYIWQRRADFVEESISQVSENLDHKPYFLEVIEEVMQYSESDRPWTESDMSRATKDWLNAQRSAAGVTSPLWGLVGKQVSLASVIRLISIEEFVRLLIGRGIVNGVFKEQISYVAGMPRISYDFDGNDSNS